MHVKYELVTTSIPNDVFVIVRTSFFFMGECVCTQKCHFFARWTKKVLVESHSRQAENVRGSCKHRGAIESAKSR